MQTLVPLSYIGCNVTALVAKFNKIITICFLPCLSVFSLYCLHFSIILSLDCHFIAINKQHVFHKTIVCNMLAITTMHNKNKILIYNTWHYNIGLSQAT